MKLAFVLPALLFTAVACNPIENMPTLNSVPAMSLWQVQASSAQIAMDDLGSEWDLDGSAPDIVIRLSCPTATGQSTAESTQLESYNPTWMSGGCFAKAIDIVSDGVELEAVDIDDVSLTGDDDVGSTNVAIYESDLLAGTVTVTRVKSLLSATIRLIKQDLM